jgi:glycerol kinase
MLVGIDVGTSAVKAIAVSSQGDVLQRVEHGYPLSAPRPGWSEQDPDDWVLAAQAALAELGTEAAFVGLSGQMHGRRIPQLVTATTFWPCTRGTRSVNTSRGCAPSDTAAAAHIF